MDGSVRQSERECRGWAGQAEFYELCMQLDAESASQAPSHQVPHLLPLFPLPFLPFPHRFSKGIGSNALLAAFAPFTVQDTCKLPSHSVPHLLPLHPFPLLPFPRRFSKGIGSNALLAASAPFTVQDTCKLEADEACYVLNVESAMPIFTVRASCCAGGDVEAGWVMLALCW